MSRTRSTEKSWATAYQSEQRQPHGVHGGGQWTRGNINPASAAAQRNQAAIARHEALVSGHAVKPPHGGGAGGTGGGATGPDAEDQGEAAKARQLQSQAAQLEQQIDHLRADLKTVNAELSWRAANPPGASGTQAQSAAAAVAQQAKPGSAAGASSGGSSSSPFAGVSTASLQSRRADLRADIKRLKSQRARLLREARTLLRDSKKAAGASTTKGSRVASVLTPEATKAVTAGDGGGMKYFSFPIEKSQDTAEVNPADGTPDIEIWGKATDGTLDSDLQIVDPEWSLQALKTWFDTKANIRMGHDPKRPIGRGIEVQGHHIKALIADPTAKHLIRKGVLQDWSIGIMNPDIRSRDPKFRHLPDWEKAVNGVITGRADGLSAIGEISAVDRGSNFGTKFAMCKAAADGTPEWVGEVTAPEDVLAKVGAPAVYKAARPVKTVTVDLPKGVSVSFSPKDLAKLTTFRQRLVEQQAVTKAATVALGGQPAVTVRVAEKRDFDPDVGGGVDRDKIPARDFAGRNRSFPIVTQADVSDAFHSLGRAGADNYPPEKIRRNIIRIARRKGFTLPASVEAGGKKPKKAAKAAEPDMTKCGMCKGTGMTGGKPCTGCKKGRRMAKRAAKTAQPTVAKKKKVMCGNCGARQNRKHDHCSECGKPLEGAIPVMKNHQYTCLGCGKDLDKGEKYCPGCGKENPGYLPEADHQIPANKEKAARVTKRRKKGKKNKKGKPFGGRQAPPFNGDNPAEEAASKAAAVTKGNGKKSGRKGKGKTPGQAGGVPGQHETPAGPHREPDGAAIEAFERDAHMEDGDHEHATHTEQLAGLKSADPEVAAALALKALNVPGHLGALHALTCPAYTPGDVSKAFPHASFAGIDLAEWQAGSLTKAASAPLAEARSALGIWKAAATLKSAAPDLIADLRIEAHKMFRDANPGPAHFPTPGQIGPQRFNRPLITAGHEAASPGHKPPHDVREPQVGGHDAQDYTRGYIREGHAADAPENTHPAPPMPAPHSGAPTSGPARQFYTNAARDGARHALQVMHDHIAVNHPDICPMHGAEDIARHPVPTPAGVPGQPPAPGKRTKAAKAKARKAAKAKARKQRRRAAAKERRLAARVLKGKIGVDEARAKLGREPITKAAGVAAAVEPLAVEAVVSGVDPEALKAAVADALAPVRRKLKAQAKAIDAMAAQPDTSNAPFRGVALTKSSAPPAETLTPSRLAEQAQMGRLQLLYDKYVSTRDNAEREVAYREYMKTLTSMQT